MGPEQSHMITGKQLPSEEPRSSTEIESDIRNTRGRIDATLEQLGNRLKARSLLNSALDWWESRGSSSDSGGAAKEVYQNLAQHVKENPIPALMVGAGVAWMIIEAATSNKGRSYGRADSNKEWPSDEGRPSSSAEGFGELSTEAGEGSSGIVQSAKEKMEHAKQAVSGAARTVQEKASAIGDRASEAADEVGRRAQHAYDEGRSAAVNLGRGIEPGYRSSTAQLEIAMDQYPLAVGIGFAAVGALIGVLLPRTQREDKLFGEKADQIIEATKQKGQDVLEHGKNVAERVAESALTEARQQGLTPQAASETISELAGKVGQVARKAKEEATTAAKEEKATLEQPKGRASKRDQKGSSQKKSDGNG
jgi:hypothetical protein